MDKQLRWYKTIDNCKLGGIFRTLLDAIRDVIGVDRPSAGFTMIVDMANSKTTDL